MSRRYDDASVSTLKPTVWPWSTLMSVAKPWMLADPAPVMPHSLSGLPGRVFSHATGLTIGTSHGAATAGALVVTTPSPARIRIRTDNSDRRRGSSTMAPPDFSSRPRAPHETTQRLDPGSARHTRMRATDRATPDGRSSRPPLSGP